MDQNDLVLTGTESPEEESEESPSESPSADAKGGDVDDLLSLFEEAAVTSKIPSALRAAIPPVSMRELLAEARELQAILDGDGPKSGAA
jgi:hypothetical protein